MRGVRVFEEVRFSYIFLVLGFVARLRVRVGGFDFDSFGGLFLFFRFVEIGRRFFFL